MLLYGLAVLPLARKLKNPAKWKQNWYADDSACSAPLTLILEWFELLIREGPKYGYFPEPQKSFLVVSPEFFDEAEHIFKDFGVKIVTGQRFLGGFIGLASDTESWLHEKIISWVSAVEKLSKVAVDEPQAAFVALSKSVQNEWLFIQRVVAQSESTFSPLSDAIKHHFIPSLFGSSCNELEISLACRPTRHLGIGILDPVKTAPAQFQISQTATSVLSATITGGFDLDFSAHESSLTKGIQERRVIDEHMMKETQVLVDKFPENQKRALLRKINQKCSSWLSVIPSNDNNFDLSPDEFRDSIALRYGRTPVDLPKFCDADGENFDVNHALNCSKGGLVYGRHNECRDLHCDLLKLAGFKQIVSEPVLRESDLNGENGLRADWGVRGFWQPQRQAFFDVSIVNADSDSLSHMPLENIFRTRRNLKYSTYLETAKARRASFSPFIATCDAVLDNEAEGYLKRLAVVLSEKWGSSYCRVVGWLRARVQICLLRSVSLCFRGNRTKFRGAGAEDYAGLLSMDIDF